MNSTECFVKRIKRTFLIVCIQAIFIEFSSIEMYKKKEMQDIVERIHSMNYFVVSCCSNFGYLFEISFHVTLSYDKSRTISAISSIDIRS